MAMAEHPDEVLLEVRGLAKSFGGVRAVNDLNLSVEAGSVVGLIGPNGAGKSTALDLISGFQKPDAGQVIFDGREIQTLPSYRISRLGLIRTFQSAREWSRLTVMDNMLIAACHHGRDAIWRALFSRRTLARAEISDRAQARELLGRFGLLAVRDEYAGNLSGGQKRLLEFARIAIAGPQMVLLDEPLAGVNPVLQDAILEAVNHFKREHITVLIIEHNLPWVEIACDRVIAMAYGTGLATGSMQDLRANQAVVDAYLGEVAANA